MMGTGVCSWGRDVSTKVEKVSGNSLWRSCLDDSQQFYSRWRAVPGINTGGAFHGDLAVN